MTEPRFLIVIPTYNERNCVLRVVEEIAQQNLPCDVLFMDDNSPDGTADEIFSLIKRFDWIHLVQRDQKFGLASAYKEGIRWGLARHYEVIGTMDADLSHRPGYLHGLLDTMRHNDMVVGSRYVPGGGSHNWPLRRQILSAVANRVALIMTQASIHDMTAGFWFCRRSCLGLVDFSVLHSEGYAFLIELKWLLVRHGVKVAEFPIIFDERERGESKLSKVIIWEAFLLLWKIFAINQLRNLRKLFRMKD